MKKIGITLGLMSYFVFGKAMKMTGLTMSNPVFWVLVGCMVFNTIGVSLECAFD